MGMRGGREEGRGEGREGGEERWKGQGRRKWMREGGVWKRDGPSVLGFYWVGDPEGEGVWCGWHLGQKKKGKGKEEAGMGGCFDLEDYNTPYCRSKMSSGTTDSIYILIYHPGWSVEDGYMLQTLKSHQQKKKKAEGKMVSLNIHLKHSTPF